MNILQNKMVSALAMIAALLLLPPLVFTVVALTSDMSFAATIQALVEQYSGRKQNLLVVGLMGCLPLVLLALVLWLHGRAKGLPKVHRALRWSGFLALWLVMLWVNFEYWPDFLPSRVYPGYPHGLEFVIGPIFFAPVAMAVSMLAAWLVARSSQP